MDETTPISGPRHNSPVSALTVIKYRSRTPILLNTKTNDLFRQAQSLVVTRHRISCGKHLLCSVDRPRRSPAIGTLGYRAGRCRQCSVGLWRFLDS